MSKQEQAEIPGSFSSPRPESETSAASASGRRGSWKTREDEEKWDSRPLRERMEVGEEPRQVPKEEITLESRPNRDRPSVTTPLPPPGEPSSSSGPSGGDALALNQPQGGQIEPYQDPDPGSPRSQAEAQLDKVCGSIQGVLRFYCKLLTRFPCIFFLGWGLILTIIVATTWEEVVVDTDLTTFLEADSDASRNHNAFLDSLKHRRSEAGQKISDTSMLDFELHLIYQAKEVNTDRAGRDPTSGILSEAALRDIRNFEQRLRKLEGWKQLCDLSSEEQRHRCQPGESLSNYAWPTRDDALEPAKVVVGELFGLSFDGLGRERLPNRATLAYLQTTSAGEHDLGKFFPRDFDRTLSSANVMRSHFTFTATKANRDEFMQKYEEFIVKDLYSLLTTQNSKELGEYEFIRVFFAGDIIDGHEVRSTLAADAKYNVGAVVFAFLAAWMNTESFFLGMIGTTAIFSSIPLAHVMVPTIKTSIASFLSVFLMVGIGSDIIFYFTDLWRKAGDRFADEPQWERVYWSYAQCLRTCIPVVFTAASFFANLASVLRPLREFGLFMGACMLSTCIISLLVYFPALITHTNIVRPRVHHPKVPKAIAMIFEPKVEMKPSPVQRLLTLCLQVIQSGKNARWIISSIGILSVIFTIAAATTSRGGGRLPEIFPPNHNRHEGRQLLAGFAPTQPAMNSTILDRSVCQPTGNADMCSLHWCEAPVAPIDEGTCNCYRKPSKDHILLCTDIKLRTKLVGVSSLNISFLYDDYMPYVSGVFVAKDSNVSTHTWAFDSNETENLHSLVLEHWESGEVHVEPFMKLPVMHGKIKKSRKPLECAEDWICYCGSRTCQVENHWPTGQFQKFTGRRLQFQNLEDEEEPLVVGRALSENKVPEHLLTEVAVIFGLRSTGAVFFDDGSKTWEYDAAFEPSSPWAQRALRAVCTQLPDNLKVREMKCWISDFRRWLKARGEPFPTRRFGDFHADVRKFMGETPKPPSEVWFEGGNLKATAFTFKVGVAHNLRAEDMLEYRDQWGAFLKARNDAASVTANGAWHTSPTWVRAESEVLIMQSSTHVVGIAVSLGFLGVFIYTMDVILTVFVILQVMVIVAGLCFVMFVILGWSVGPLEVISLVVFVAYTITPALHIARRFFFTLEEGRKLATMALADAPDPSTPGDSMKVGAGSSAPVDPSSEDPREERTRNALVLSGSIAMSCFAKTLGCSIFLLPATLWMFAKLGTVIFVVNLLSAGLTLILFPALCVTVGPKSDAPTLVLIYRKIKQKMSPEVE